MELLILRLISFVTGRRIVLLTDFEGTQYITIERKSYHLNTTRCYVYWFTSVGDVILNEGGTTSGSSSYIENWEYIN